MKKFLSVSNTTASTDFALMVGRVGIALLMLTHGWPKLMQFFSNEPVQFIPVMGMSASMSLGLAVFAEVICSIFILIGFATRFATIPLIITMLTAAFMVHAADPFKIQESSLVYLLAYLVLLFAGSGKYSVDYLLNKASLKDKFKGKKVLEPAMVYYKK